MNTDDEVFEKNGLGIPLHEIPRRKRRNGRLALQKVKLILRSVAVALAFGCTTWGCAPVDTTDFAEWPVDATGYEIEQIPVDLGASFVRGSDVYFGRGDGAIFRADDRDLSHPWISLGRPYTFGPRLLFASSSGILFTSPTNLPLVRSDDDGRTWHQCLDIPVWRMDEDERGTLYAGNYNKVKGQVATLYRSTDGGATWNIIYENPVEHHIHTVRWDELGKRIYISYGDGPTRGQAYSDDRGATFHALASGHGQGHTDVAFTTDYILWAADDAAGHVYRTGRQTSATERLLGRSQYMWWAVARDELVYVGTMASAAGDRACLLASDDQGNTWRRLLETSPAAGDFDKGLVAESRKLSSAGWLYFAAEGISYRVRKTPQPSGP